MVSALELIAGSLKKSFDLRLWLCFLLISFLNIVVFFITSVILLVPAATIYYIFGAGTVSTVLWAILAIIGIIIFLYTGAVFWAIILFIAKDFSEKGKISLNDSWNNALQRAPQLFLATAILFIIFSFLFAVLMLPSLVPLADAVSTISPSAIFDPMPFVAPIMQSLIVLMAMLACFFLIIILVSPFTVLVAPTVVFGNISAFTAIKKSLVAAKENYWRNLSSIIIYFVVVLLISGFFLLVAAGLNILGILLLEMPGFAVARLALELINFILQIFSMIIMLAFVSVFSVNYYKANYFNIAPQKTEQKEEEKEPSVPKDEILLPSEKETTTIKLEPWMGKKI